MLIDDYMVYLRESYEIYDEDFDKPESKKKSALKTLGVAAGVAGASAGASAIRAGSHGAKLGIGGVANYHKDVRDAVKNGAKLTAENRKAIRQGTKKILGQGMNQAKADAKKAIKQNAKTALIAGGIAGAAYGAKKLHDHIKAKRAEKAKKVAFEEGISLSEAYDFILECEQDLLNEGFSFEEIY